MSILSLMEKMLVFVVLIAVGYISVRKGSLSTSFIKDASKLAINVFMSATIVVSCISIDSSVSNAEVINALWVISLMMVLCFAIGAAASLITPLDKALKPVYELLISTPNAMFIALPVLQQLYGAQAVFYCALSSLPLDILFYTYGVMRLNNGGGVNLKDFISAPLIASIIGVALFFMKIELPNVAENILSILSGATMPMSMIVVGGSLGSASVAKAFADKRLYLMSFVRLIINPVVVFLVCRLLNADAILTAASVIIAASPSAVSVSVVTIQYGRDGVFASEGVLVSTMLSMLTIPMVIWVMNML